MEKITYAIDLVSTRLFLFLFRLPRSVFSRVSCKTPKNMWRSHDSEKKGSSVREIKQGNQKEQLGASCRGATSRAQWLRDLTDH